MILSCSSLGAGSILAALRGPALAPKKTSTTTTQLIVIPNDSLMDSHQSDLADELSSKGWAHVASPEWVGLFKSHGLAA